MVLPTEKPRRRRWNLRRIVAPVVLGLAASLLTTGTAHARTATTVDDPWNLPGSAWQGTISTSIHRDMASEARRIVQDEQAVYTELEVRSATASGNYTAFVDGSGSEQDYQDSCGNGTLRLTNEGTWSVAEHYRQHPYFPDVLRITTDEQGLTSIIPGLVSVDVTYDSHGCDGEVFTSTAHTTVLGFQSGESGHAKDVAPVPDEDPDPLRLVGSKTWTLADPPYELYAGYADYSFTVTYDLTLVLPEDCRSFTGAFTAKLDELKMFRYSLEDVLYCREDSRAIIRGPGKAMSAPVYPAGFAGALDILGMKFRYDGSSPVEVVNHASGAATASVKGRYSFCMDLPLKVLKQGAKAVFDRLPGPIQRKVLNWMDQGARFFVRKLFGSALVPDWLPRALLDKGVKKTINALPMSTSKKTALRSLVDFVRSEAVGSFEDYMVSLLTDGICIPRVWTPNIVVAVPATGRPSASEVGTSGIFTVVPYQP